MNADQVMSTSVPLYTLLLPVAFLLGSYATFKIAKFAVTNLAKPLLLGIASLFIGIATLGGGIFSASQGSSVAKLQPNLGIDQVRTELLALAKTSESTDSKAQYLRAYLGTFDHQRSQQTPFLEVALKNDASSPIVTPVTWRNEDTQRATFTEANGLGAAGICGIVMGILSLMGGLFSTIFHISRVCS